MDFYRSIDPSSHLGETPRESSAWNFLSGNSLRRSVIWELFQKGSEQVADWKPEMPSPKHTETIKKVEGPISGCSKWLSDAPHQGASNGGTLFSSESDISFRNRFEIFDSSG